MTVHHQVSATRVISVLSELTIFDFFHIFHSVSGASFLSLLLIPVAYHLIQFLSGLPTATMLGIISWRSFWLVPIFSGCVWLGMLLGMFLWWVINTHKAVLPPEDTRQGETIPYVPCPALWKYGNTAADCSIDTSPTLEPTSCSPFSLLGAQLPSSHSQASSLPNVGFDTRTVSLETRHCFKRSCPSSLYSPRSSA